MIKALFRKFFVKLVLTFCVILAASMALTSFLITRTLKNQLVRELTLSLATDADLIKSEIDPSLLTRADAASPAQGSRLAALQELAKRFGHAGACRVTIIRADGTVIADSELTPQELLTVENHKERPEVQSALRGAGGSAMRFSHTIKQNLLYSAVPIRFGDAIAGVARVALPLTQVERKVEDIRLTIFWISSGVLCLGLLAAMKLSRSLSRPVDSMSGVARTLAQGDFDARVPRFRTTELDQLGQTLNFLARRIQDTVSELSNDKAQLSTILANMVEAVAAVDAAGRIVVLNPALSHMFGVEAGTARGRPFLEVLRHNKLHELLDAVLKGQGPRVDEVKIFTPDEHIFEVHTVPLISGGRQNGALLVLHDVTRIRRLEQVRRDFVANVSHELKTPLSSIKGFAETLGSGAIEDKKNRLDFVQSIESQANRMADLVDDLLDLAAIESGQRPLEKEPVSLLKLARDVANDLKPLADQRNVSVEVAEVSVPEAHGDWMQLKQVLTNLIGNAIKFNKNGGTVRVDGRVDGAFVAVSVQDSGSGIPAQDLPRIFERFYRVDKARSRELGGTGLGLSIVKHIVESHGGMVSVESSVGKGSRFDVRLPIAP